MARVAPFSRPNPRPTALRTVADWRYGDALCLKDTGERERANGAIYLGGFAIECLLKAALVEKYAWLQSKVDPAKLDKDDHRTWSLCFRSHDLAEILDRLPELKNKLKARDQARTGPSLLTSMKQVCGIWTVTLRYSSKSATAPEAAVFLGKVKELKACLATRNS